MINIYSQLNEDGKDFFGNLKKDIDNRRDEILERVGIYLLKRTKENFLNSRDIYSKEFEPIRTRKNGTSKPLVNKAILQNSFLIQVIQDGVVIKSNINYASFHNNGTDKIKKRQFLPSNYLPSDYRDDILTIIENSLKFDS